MTFTFYKFFKRIADIILGFILLILSLPLLIIFILLIRLESPGNPVFIQWRVGLKGEKFKIYKLRGMYSDSRIRFPDLYKYDGNKDLNFYFHHMNDPRVTKIGAFIRSSSIDELPNFINVILGSMSLVGPRPEIPEVIEMYGEFREKYLSVKPGVTCYSKCSGRDSLTKHETIQMDLAYVDSCSLMTDIAILWKTFLGVIFKKNVY